MKTYTELIKTKQKYDALISKLESELKDKIEFDFGIEYQVTDGLCIISAISADLAPLDDCLKVIEKKGILSLDDFDDLGI